MMNLEQGLSVIKAITRFYPNFSTEKEKTKEWVKILQDYDFETVMENLREHIKYSPFAPTMADLLQLEKPKKHEETAASKSIAYLPWSEEIQAERDEEARQMRISIEGEKELTPEEIQRGKDFIKAMKERRKFNNGNKQ